MKKKRDKHDEPRYCKGTKTNKQRSKHSILHQHELKMQEISNKKERVMVLESKIKTLHKELEKLNKERSYKHLNQEYLFSNVDAVISTIKDNIKQHEKEKLYIESGQEETDYILDSTNIIVSYSDLESQEKILLEKKEHTDEDVNELNLINLKKQELVDTYLKKFDPTYISPRSTYDSNMFMCSDCNERMDVQHGYLVCYQCGKCKTTVEHSGELSFKEMQDYDYRPQFTYEKETHLEDWLRRFQAKENRCIPQEVLDKVILEANKERLKDLTTLTEDKVKRYLKKLDLNDYYDNVIAIINRINKRPPFTLTPESEQKIKVMFRQIQEPFAKHKPNNRKNFLSYSYTLHKFFQILGLHEFCKYFPLLKSADKLRQQDEIFKKIVAEMAMTDKTVNWVFYPSI
jgi:hypothetical protein